MVDTRQGPRAIAGAHSYVADSVTLSPFTQLSPDAKNRTLHAHFRVTIEGAETGRNGARLNVLAVHARHA